MSEEEKTERRTCNDCSDLLCINCNKCTQGYHFDFCERCYKEEERIVNPPLLCEIAKVELVVPRHFSCNFCNFNPTTDKCKQCGDPRDHTKKHKKQKICRTNLLWCSKCILLVGKSI